MKKAVITLTVIIAAILFSSSAHAQKINEVAPDINSVVPGMTLRPLTKSEASRLNTVKALNITACCSASIAAAAAVGAIAYDIEAREASSKNFDATSASDAKASKMFVVGASVSAGVCLVSAITSVSIKSTLRHKTIVKASTGGFVLEF